MAEGNKFMKDMMGNAHGAWLHGYKVTRWTTPSTVNRWDEEDLPQLEVKLVLSIDYTRH